MQTLILNTDKKSLEIASNIIHNGGLVAFPTETVYGLGGNALAKDSVLNIYKAKGRPQDNPLIVHVCDENMLQPLVKDVCYKAKLLIKSFCPGPLTLILHKTDLIPDEITGNKSTVGVRIPSNETALNFIKKTNLPIAAPSANLSGKPSPTSFEHVKEDLFGRIDGIIKDEDTKFGLESTIIDMTQDTPTLLRPGSITISMIEKVIGDINISPYIVTNTIVENDNTPIAPGMKYKHYSPDAELIIFKCDFKRTSEHINNLILNDKRKIGILTNDEFYDRFDSEKYSVLSLGNNICDYGKNLFKRLREFNALGVDVIYSFYFDEDDESLAFMNRLKKASGFNIIEI